MALGKWVKAQVKSQTKYHTLRPIRNPKVNIKEEIQQGNNITLKRDSIGLSNVTRNAPVTFHSLQNYTFSWSFNVNTTF